MLKKFFSNRLSYLGLILLLVGGLFGSVLFDLQVVQGDSYREQADASSMAAEQAVSLHSAQTGFCCRRR